MTYEFLQANTWNYCSDAVFNVTASGQIINGGFVLHGKKKQRKLGMSSLSIITDEEKEAKYNG